MTVRTAERNPWKMYGICKVKKDIGLFNEMKINQFHVKTK